jgi:DNA-binding MarR family transcriptional regulator
MNTTDPYEITWLIRRLFRAMAQHANQSLAEQGISAADRAVLEFLYPDKSLSVPEIAHRYQVSRQHVQVTVNRLHGLALVQSKDNPKHKRSPLISLTRSGSDLFKSVLATDRQQIKTLFADLPVTNIKATRRTLAKLLAKLNGGEN